MYMGSDMQERDNSSMGSLGEIRNNDSLYENHLTHHGRAANN
eukprot:CAMPEP_0119314694 /NCGR_PEP_ID=MMETSP1333-20130426/33702_1 /TAXON_ID=418940 /ORGANISM="Scyphosphaera apsteinii, Strain RCC1455" /LENGTH=41 /DNA_ID= /DNA_START= /DNA_END= /DNA_ORIENTATION=